MAGERRRPARMPKIRLEVLPTRTIYDFSSGGVQLTLTFFTPAMPGDLDVLSRPLTYIEWTASSADGNAHDVSLYFDASSELTVNTPDQPVQIARFRTDGLPVLRAGSREQATLAKRGDDLRIDWGYLYLAADRAEGVTEYVGDRAAARAAFDSGGRLPESDDLTEGRRGGPVLAFGITLGRVSAQPVSRYLMLAYDDVFGIEYFQRKERAWWRRNGAEAVDMIPDARRDHDS